MGSNPFCEATGCVTYYTFMPVVWCHAIITTGWTTVRMVYVMSKPGMPTSTTTTTQTPVPSSTSCASKSGPTRESFSTHILHRQLAELENEKAKRRWSRQSSSSHLLQQQLAELENERIQRCRSPAPSYHTYQEDDDTPPQLPPLNLDFSEKLLDAKKSLKPQAFVLQIVEKKRPYAVDQPRPVAPMSYIKAHDEGATTFVHMGAGVDVH
ncbi:hypothetical protein NpNSSI1_00008585 [Neofusicoccum parvum]|nr:hypothetical protein NpNSSI1_00008585 [Neofusicoccum parvum]